MLSDRIKEAAFFLAVTVAVLVIALAFGTAATYLDTRIDTEPVTIEIRVYSRESE